MKTSLSREMSLKLPVTQALSFGFLGCGDGLLVSVLRRLGPIMTATEEFHEDARKRRGRTIVERQETAEDKLVIDLRPSCAPVTVSHLQALLGIGLKKESHCIII